VPPLLLVWLPWLLAPPLPLLALRPLLHRRVYVVPRLPMLLQSEPQVLLARLPFSLHYLPFSGLLCPNLASKLALWRLLDRWHRRRRCGLVVSLSEAAAVADRRTRTSRAISRQVRSSVLLDSPPVVARVTQCRLSAAEKADHSRFNAHSQSLGSAGDAAGDFAARLAMRTELNIAS